MYSLQFSPPFLQLAKGALTLCSIWGAYARFWLRSCATALLLLRQRGYVAQPSWQRGITSRGVITGRRGPPRHQGWACSWGKATYRAPPWQCLFGRRQHGAVLGTSHPGGCKGWARSLLQKEIRRMGSVNRATENAPKCHFWTAPQETHTPATYRVWFLFVWVCFLNKSTVPFMLCCLAVAHGTKSLLPFTRWHLYLPLFLFVLVLGK